MSIILDSREHHLIKQLPSLPVEQLDIGDIHIRHNDKIIIIERKTVQDLRQSIGDGRYREQKQRLISFNNSNKDTSKIMYIIEGIDKFEDLNSLNKYSLNSLNSKNSNNVIGAILNTIMRDNIQVIMLRSMDDTITFIQELAKRMISKHDEYFSINDESNINHTELLIHQKKKNNVTPEVVFLMQLSSIPGISYKKASTIANELGATSILTFIKKFDNEDSKVNIKLLSSIKGIGKTTAQTILKYLGIL